MSRAQRLTFLAIAAAIAIVAAIVLSGSGGDDEQPATTAATATATATPEPQEAEPGATETPSPTATATPRPQPPLIGPGKLTKLRFTEGETVRFRVRADAPDEIHIHGYDRYVDVGPGKPETVSFRADLVGIWEIELHGTGERIAQLRVDPQ